MIKKVKKATEKVNLANQAYTILRDRIYNNEIKPGDIINEGIISKELGISRTPVREAIRMLASEDIVEVRDGIGTFVKMLSFKDIKDIFEVRKSLEIIAVKTSINRIPQNEIKKLESRLVDLFDKCDKGVVIKEEFSDLDMNAHQLIIDYCDNEYVKSIFESIKLKIKQYQFISYENLNNSKESITQHLEILKRLDSRDLEGLIKVLDSHIDWSLKGLI